MTSEAANTDSILLDSRDVLKKRRRLENTLFTGIFTTFGVFAGGVFLVIPTKSSNLLGPAVAMGIVGAIFVFFAFKNEKEATRAHNAAVSEANAAITNLLKTKYSIQLLEPVKFHVDSSVSKRSLDYITVLKEPLSALDLKTLNRTQVILKLSNDRTDVEAAILSVATA